MASPAPSVSVPNTAIWGQAITGKAQPVGITAATAATGTLTLAGNAVAGEQVRVGEQFYTWAASAAVQTPNVVKIGASASDSIDNLISAIVGTAADQGSLYSYNTIPNLLATAAQGAGDTMTVTALQNGADGNRVITTETMSQGSWGAATLTGGVSGALLTSGAGGGSSPAGVPVTHNNVLLSASAQIIPAGAKGWTATCITGTMTIGSAAGLPAGFSDSDVNTLAVALTVTAAAASTAYVAWNT